MTDLKAIEAAVDALCPLCHGAGYTVEPRCCEQRGQHGQCCGNPEPEQVQCNCQIDNDSRTALLTLIEGVCRERDGLREAVKPLALIPLEEFGKHHQNPDHNLMGWNNHSLYVRDVFAARTALAATDEVQK